MKQSRMTIAVAAVALITGCASTRDVRRATLQCKNAYNGGSSIGLYSFTAGELTVPPIDPDQVDIVYYFDSDDCSQGALMGHDDRPGYLFPVGRKSWSKLLKLEPPSKDGESVDAIAPLTKDKEGLAFWVKARDGEYILARIRAVQAASYSDLVSGRTATLELEWSRPRPNEKRKTDNGQRTMKNRKAQPRTTRRGD